MQITVTTGGKSITLQTTRLPNRKKPVLCKIENGNQFYVIAHFLDDESRAEFDKMLEVLDETITH